MAMLFVQGIILKRMDMLSFGALMSSIPPNLSFSKSLAYMTTCKRDGWVENEMTTSQPQKQCTRHSVVLTVAAIVDLQSSSCFDPAAAAADKLNSPAPMILFHGDLEPTDHSLHVAAPVPLQGLVLQVIWLVI